MNLRKQMLVAALVTVAVPLAATAGTPETTGAPLSNWAAIGESQTLELASNDSGAPVSYSLLSHSDRRKSDVDGAQPAMSTRETSGASVQYALSSYTAYGRE